MNSKNIGVRHLKKTNSLKLFANKICLVLGILFFCLATQASANPPGQIDFADLSKTYGEAKVEVNLSKALIGMVGAFSQKEDPEIAEILNKIESIKVRVYKLDGNPDLAFKTIADVTKSIRALNWEPIVSVNEENEKVRIFAKATDGVMDGLVVMAVDKNGPGEAVFINIVGQIDPAKISKITKSLDIDVGE